MRRASSAGVAHGKADVDGFGGFVFVFHFGFGERGTAVQTPVHRLETAHHMATGDDFTQARTMPASVCGCMVRYGCAQSPKTPRRMKSAFCSSIWLAA